MTEDMKKNIQLWLDKEISLEECIKRTGYSRSHLFNLKKKLKK